MNRPRSGSSLLDCIRWEVLDHRANTESLGQIQEQIATAFISRARTEKIAHTKIEGFRGSPDSCRISHVIQAESLLDDGSALDIQSTLLKFEDAARMAPCLRVLSAVSACARSNSHFEGCDHQWSSCLEQKRLPDELWIITSIKRLLALVRHSN
jgi:hypothetical protein